MKYAGTRLGGAVLTVLSACSTSPQPSPPELLFTDAPATWVPPLPEVQVSADERWAAFGAGAWLHLVDLETGATNDARRLGELESVTALTFGSDGKVLRKGLRDGVSSWFLGDERLEDVPHDAVPRISPDGRLAFRPAGAPRTLSVDGTAISLDGDIRAFAWTPDGSGLLVLATQDDGDSSLLRVAPAGGTTEVVTNGLDVPLRGDAMGPSPEGDLVYLALASAGPLDLAARHEADADRDLDIYELDLTTGELAPVVGTPMDELSPRAVGNHLYWTRVDYRQSIVVLPSGGGDAHHVAEGGQIPYWSHDGELIAYTAGLPLASDAPLNMEADVVELDDAARPVSPPRRLISGYHEDFTPAWSPDGAWLAFHSHRSPTPVASYHGEGSTDDLYLLRAGAATSEEIRLTDFGWEVGMADWSPDGRRLAFVSWDEDVPGIGVPWIVTIDAATGQALSAERLGLPEPLRSARLVAWSPVDDVLAIENDDGNGEQTIYLLELNGLEAPEPRAVVTYPSDTYSGLDWTPDGERLVYSARVDGVYQIFDVPRAGGAPRRLSNDEAQLMQPQVSPDGRWIAATRIAFRRELWRQRR